jgi:uncharacterized membrane protein YbhN (UPF0104 family)
MSTRGVVGLFFGAFIVFVCIRYVVTSFQWPDIFQVLKRVDLVWLLVGGGLSILLHWVFRTLRWTIILKGLGVDTNFVDLYLCYSVSSGFSLITPLRSGEMIKIELLKNYGLIDRLPGYSSYIVERIVDLFIIVSIATTSLLVGFDLITNRQHVYWLFGTMIVALFIGVLALHKLKFGGRAGEFLHDLIACVQNLKVLSVVLLLSLCAWALVAAGWQVCLYSISISIGFLNSMALMCVTLLVSVMSLVPGAVGVSEVSITEFLVHLGYGPVEAQAGALVTRVYSFLIICLSGFHFLVLKIRRSK